MTRRITGFLCSFGSLCETRQHSVENLFEQRRIGVVRAGEGKFSWIGDAKFDERLGSGSVSGNAVLQQLRRGGSQHDKVSGA